MMFTTIQIVDLSLEFPHKMCFEAFKASIFPDSKIALIGRNGCGKSSLLRILRGECEPSSGKVKVPEGVKISYVPQILDQDELSGGERFIQALHRCLDSHPDLLLLDEPTNHLDRKRRAELFMLLDRFDGALVIVSHDVELLERMETLWHIDEAQVHQFSGRYRDYMRSRAIQHAQLEKELKKLEGEKKKVHQSLMREQKRAAKSRKAGKKNIEQRKWPTTVSASKADRAGCFAGKKKAQIRKEQKEVKERLSALHLPEVIKPNFSLSAAEIGVHTIVSISDGAVGYEQKLIENITLNLSTAERIALMGDNGSGKTTLIKAIMGEVKAEGEWRLPNLDEIGYLDQHYAQLDFDGSVLEFIEETRRDWSHADVRHHLNRFLFRNNQEVSVAVRYLSGGERVRLCLAQIAAKTPKLLILDEITNNIDLETREHVIQVLSEFPGALLVISHDLKFLDRIGIEDFYEIQKKSLAHSYIEQHLN